MLSRAHAKRARFTRCIAHSTREVGRELAGLHLQHGRIVMDRPGSGAHVCALFQEHVDSGLGVRRIIFGWPVRGAAQQPRARGRCDDQKAVAAVSDGDRRAGGVGERLDGEDQVTAGAGLTAPAGAKTASSASRGPVKPWVRAGWRGCGPHAPRRGRTRVVAGGA